MDLVGKRISVRYRSAEGDRDVIGHVRRADPAEGLLLERRDGERVLVPAGTVRFMRVVPDRPLRRRAAAAISADRLTGVTSRGWPAVESVPLGEWELRASHGFTGRANSVAVHGDPGVGDPFAAVIEFYAQRGLKPLAQVVEGSEWDRRFASAGWGPVAGQPGGALVQVADLVTAPPADPEVVLADHASDSWLRSYGRVDDPAVARAVIEGPPTVGFAALGDVGIGRVVVTGEWAGLAAVEVDPAARRRGSARRIVETCLAWAVSHGADKAYVQVMPDNGPALALYAPFGFTTHHAYRYLTPPRVESGH